VSVRCSISTVFIVNSTRPIRGQEPTDFARAGTGTEIPYAETRGMLVSLGRRTERWVGFKQALTELGRLRKLSARGSSGASLYVQAARESPSEAQHGSEVALVSDVPFRHTSGRSVSDGMAAIFPDVKIVATCKGTGLGLSMVYGVVEQSNRQRRCQS
jgi:hypothetical protein